MLTTNSESAEFTRITPIICLGDGLNLGSQEHVTDDGYLHQVGECGKGKGETLGMVIGISRVRVRGACL